MPSKAVEVREVALDAHGALPTDAILEAVKNGTKLRLNVEDADVAAAMLERKLSAKSIEEMTNAGELDDIKDIYGVAVRVFGVGFRNSDDAYAKEQGSLGVYVILNVATLSGEVLAVGTGALDVVVTACKILELDKLDTWWIIKPADKKTKAGYAPLNMVPAAGPDSSGNGF